MYSWLSLWDFFGSSLILHISYVKLCVGSRFPAIMFGVISNPYPRMSFWEVFFQVLCASLRRLIHNRVDFFASSRFPASGLGVVWSHFKHTSKKIRSVSFQFFYTSLKRLNHSWWSFAYAVWSARVRVSVPDSKSVFQVRHAEFFFFPLSSNLYTSIKSLSSIPREGFACAVEFRQSCWVCFRRDFKSVLKQFSFQLCWISFKLFFYTTVLSLHGGLFA